MKRRYGHLLFALPVAGFAVSALIAAWQLRAAEQTAAAVVAASAGTQQEIDLKRPEAALAHALLLAYGDDYERALRAYEPLLQSPRDDIRLTARYDLGNLHLRQALKLVDEQLAKARTLVELAKQNYRGVLEVEPDDWDARYNLERALWLEPEHDEGAVDVTPPPLVTRPNGDKPDLP